MNIRRSVGMFLTGTCAVSFASSAIAQTAGTTNANAQPTAVQSQGNQNEIIITAQKRTQRLIDVPQSVSVISGDSLEKQHAQRLSDYLTRIPSANVVESQAGNSRIVLRGINTGGVGATVATYIDETPFGSATSLANGAILAPDLDPFDIARVEVLRGPQGTLYGANSLGGLVKYVTVAPDPRSFDGAAELGGENLSHGEFGWWGRAALNVPLASDAAFRATGFYRRDPGYVDDPNQGKDVNHGHTYGGRISALFAPGTHLKIRLTAMLENLRSDGTNAVDLDPVTLRSAYGGLSHARLIAEPNDIKDRIYNATIDYDFGPVALVSATSYGTVDQHLLEDASAVYGPLLTGALGMPLGAGVDQRLSQRRFTQEVRLASTHNDVFEWTIGGFYTHEKNRLGQDLYAVDGVSGATVPSLDGLVLVDLPSRYTEYAGFVNATWHVVPKFDITAGGRWSHNKQSEEQDTNGLLVGSSVFGGHSSDSVFTYAVAPTFKPNANTRIYARVAKGYRPGGPNAVSPLASDAVPRTFGPDTTTNYEVGVKTETDDHLLSLEAAAFIIDWKDIQLLAQIDNLGVNVNGGAARSKGVEFTAGLNPNRSLSLYATGSYVDAHLIEDAPAAVGGFRGDPLPYNPKWQWTIGAEYERPMSPNATGHAGISWHYTGVRYADFQVGTAQHRLPAYSQLDAHMGVDVGRFRIDAFAHNLTDSRGITNVGFFGDVNGNLAAAVIRPRSFGLALGYRY